MKNVSINLVTKRDENFLRKNAQLTKELFNRKSKYNEILVAKVDNKSVGFLIFDYLWTDVPFMAQIWIFTDYRKIGIGRGLLNYFELYLSDNNHTMLFSSSMENAKETQAWHKHMGFKECGFISEINDDNTGEVFFRKSLKRDSQCIA